MSCRKKNLHLKKPASFYFVHGFDNLKQKDAKALAVITPALPGSIFFKEVAAILNAGGPPDIEKLKLTMAKHGLIPVIPKLQNA